MIREIKLHKAYKANLSFLMFPPFIILTKKVFNDKTLEEQYVYFDIKSGREDKHLTKREVELVYEEISDQYF